MIKVTLTQSKMALIDDSYAYISHKNWYADKYKSAGNFQWYAGRHIPKINGKSSVILMHREIMETKLGRPLLRTEQIDHINHDGLDNRIINLRIATSSQNIFNQRIQTRNKSSIYIGVSWRKDTASWNAYIKKDRKKKYLGLFTTEKEAAYARDIATKLYFGEYANLNFPMED
jgi:hypothetical protein